jgi:hypothetical protein
MRPLGPFYQPVWTTKGWRILCRENGMDRDLCGAINEAVAWDQCALLNAMRRALP